MRSSDVYYVVRKSTTPSLSNFSGVGKSSPTSWDNTFTSIEDLTIGTKYQLTKSLVDTAANDSLIGKLKTSLLCTWGATFNGGSYYGSLDIILDDGDHIWESQLKFFNLYYDLLNPGGILACEDITQIYLPQLQQLGQQYEDFYIFDLRAKNNTHANEIIAFIKKPL